MGLFNYIRNGTHQSSLILLQPISLDIFLTSQRKFHAWKKKKIRFLKLPFQTILVLERMKMNRKLGKQGRRKIPLLFFLFRVLKIKKQWKVEKSTFSKENVLQVSSSTENWIEGLWGGQTSISLKPQVMTVFISLSHNVQKNFTLKRLQQLS